MTGRITPVVGLPSGGCRSGLVSGFRVGKFCFILLEGEWWEVICLLCRSGARWEHKVELGF